MGIFKKKQNKKTIRFINSEWLLINTIDSEIIPNINDLVILDDSNEYWIITKKIFDFSHPTQPLTFLVEKFCN